MSTWSYCCVVIHMTLGNVKNKQVSNTLKSLKPVYVTNRLYLKWFLVKYDFYNTSYILTHWLVESPIHSENINIVNNPVIEKLLGWYFPLLSFEHFFDVIYDQHRQCKPMFDLFSSIIQYYVFVTTYYSW